MIILQPSAGNSSGNNAVAAQEVGEAGNFAPRDLGGAEALFHEFKGGVAERGEGAFGAVEEAGEELVDEGVDAKGDSGKVLCAALVKARTSVKNDCLASRLRMGHPAAMSQLVSRTLKDPKSLKILTSMRKTV